jgi:hypothetical protein
MDILLPNMGGIGKPTTSTIDPIASEMQAFKQAPTNLNNQANPQFFDWDGNQTDRYTQSPYYKNLGFDPNIGAENEYKYGNMQTWGNMMSNAFKGMGSLAANTFVEGWKGWGDIYEALKTWDGSKLVGDPDSLMQANKEMESIMNKYAIYKTPESENTIFNRQLFGDLIQQSGFAVGTIGQFLSEELLTMGLGTQFSIAKLGIKVPKWLGQSVKISEVAKDLKRLGDAPWRIDPLAEGLYKAAKSAVPFLDTTTDIIKYKNAGAGVAQLASIGLGGFKRALSEANLAFTEARMEAAGTYGELYNRLYDEHVNNTGQAPLGAELDRIKNISLTASQENFGVNSAILMATNRLQFDNLFSKYRFGRRKLNENSLYKDEVLKVTGKTASGQDLSQVYQKGALGTLGVTSKIAKDFGRKRAAWELSKSALGQLSKWEVSEGIQELFQSISDDALKSYYYDLYHGVEGTELDESVKEAFNKQVSVEGAKTFLMGAVTGRLLSPINAITGIVKERVGSTKQQRDSRKTDIKDSVDAVNAFFNAKASGTLSEAIANLKVQNKAGQTMAEAIANRDQYIYQNAKDSAFSKLVSSAIKTNMADALLDTLRGYSDSFNDEQFKQAFGMDKTEDNIQSTKEFFNKVANSVEKYHNRWKSLKDRYSDLVIPEIYQENTEARAIANASKRALDDALEILAGTSYKAEQAIGRSSDIMNKAAAIPNIGSSIAYGYKVFSSDENQDKEIALLKEEIKNYEQAPGADKNAKEILKFKKAQLASLESWKENQDALSKMKRPKKKEYKRSLKAFQDYVSSKNLENRNDSIVTVEDAQNIYEDLLDIIQLNKDHKSYIDAFNILANPTAFVQAYERLYRVIDTVTKEFKKEAENEVKGIAPSPQQPPVSQIPSGIKESDVVAKEEGILLIQNFDDTTQEFVGYNIIDSNGNVVSKIQEFPNHDENTYYEEKEQAMAVFTAAVRERKKDNSPYKFDGKTIAFGTVLVSNTGRKAVVQTKVSPKIVNNKPTISILPEGDPGALDITSLEGYQLESEIQAPADNKFRLINPRELSRVYPHLEGPNDTREAAEQRFHKLLSSISKEDLENNISIKLEPSAWSSPGKIESGNASPNPNLYRNESSKNQVTILYKDKPIGYLTNPNKYSYKLQDGSLIPIQKITKEQFLDIFNPMNEDPNNLYKEFLDSWKQSQTVWDYLSNAKVLTSADKDKFYTILTTGMYDFSIGDGAALKDLDYNTVMGHTYVLDRQKIYLSNGMYREALGAPITSLGATKADETIREAIEKAIEEEDPTGEKLLKYGRYVSVVQLPSGRVRFVELKPPTITDAQAQEFVDLINVRSTEARLKNVETALDDKNKPFEKSINPAFTEDVNKRLIEELFIALGVRSGKSVTITLLPTGNLKAEVFDRRNNANKDPKSADARRSVVIKTKSGFNFKNIDELIDAINTAFLDHDNYATTETKNKIKLNLKRSQFKISLPSIPTVDQVRELSTNVNKPVVKTPTLSFAIKSSTAYTAPVSQPQNPVNVGTPPPVSEAPAGKDIKVDDANVIIDQERKAKAEAKMKAFLSGKSESNTENKAQKLKRLKQELSDLTEQLDKDLQAQGFVKLSQRRSLIDGNEQVIKLNQEIDDIENTASADKILSTLDYNNITAINEFEKFIKKNFPDFITVSETLPKKLKNGNITVGEFYQHVNTINNRIEGTINTSDVSPYKYHEAFHAVFRMLFTDRELSTTIELAKKKSAKERQAKGTTLNAELKNLVSLNPSKYGKLSREQLENLYYEEWLADKFEDWTNNKYKPEEERNIFQKIWDFIRRLLSTSLEDIFVKIHKGEYKNRPYTGAYNKYNVGISDPAWKIIKVGVTYITDEDGTEIEIPRYLSEQESSKLSSTIAALLHLKISNSDVRVKVDDVLDSILDSYGDLYNPQSPRYSDPEFIDSYASYEDYKLANNKLKDLYKLFSDRKLRKELKDSVQTHLNIMGYKNTLEEDEYDQKRDDIGKTADEYWKESFSIGGYSSLSKELRQYISTVTTPVKDQFGNEYLDPETKEPLIEAVDANTLYNGVLKAVAGNTDERKILSRLKHFAKYNPEASAFYDKFIKDTGLEITDEDIIIHNTQAANLYQLVIKGFQQYSVNYLFINKDIKKGVTRVFSANRKDSSKTQFSIWYNAYRTLFESPLMQLKTAEEKTKFINSRISVLKRLSNLFRPKAPLTKAEDLNQISEEIALDLANNLGINISPLLIQYSYIQTRASDELTVDQLDLRNMYSEVEPFSLEDIQQLQLSITSLKSPFTKHVDADAILSQKEKDIAKTAEEELTDQIDIPEESEDISDDGGNISRLLKMARSNSIFDETVNTTSFKNADGEMVYSHQLPTYHLVRMTELSNKDKRDELKNDPFFKNHYLLENEDFNHIADKLQIERIDGLKDSSLKLTDDNQYIEDKNLSRNRNKGVTYGSMSPREFMVSLFELYSHYKINTVEEGSRFRSFASSQHLLAVLEASNTGDTISLPVIKAVENSKKGLRITSKTFDILFNEVQREFDRIKQVQEEIDSNVPQIEDYHTGKKKGLQFNKTANMLNPGLKEMLEKVALTGEDINIYKEQIRESINDYWDKELKETLSILRKERLVYDDDGKLRTQILNKNVIEGFKSPDGKYMNDVNNMLNIIPNFPEHNVFQVIVNDFINTLSINQLITGTDSTKVYKIDAIDEVKRNKFKNGSGAHIASSVLAPELGIVHKNEKSHVVVIKDPQYLAKYAGGKKDKADAQMWMTPKTLRYTLFGLGKLNQQQAYVLDKIERGESFTSEEIFGDGKSGSIYYNAQTNSIKLVYFDGQKSVKTSGFILTKEFTSYKVGDRWIEKPHMKELHDLREKLEDYQNRNQTITFAIPVSAAKNMKINVAANISSISDNNFTEHDNRFWRLQLENPSNKTVITDPTQAKHLVLAEQYDDLEVWSEEDGEYMKMGDIKKRYLSTTAERIKAKYITTRDEIFSIDQAFGELKKTIETSKITPSLGNFLKRAVSNLEATGADPQTIELFKPLIDKDGNPQQRYDLNGPITIDKFTQLFLAYFSKGVLSEKVPGTSLALVSNYGARKIKKVLELDSNGQPKRWEVVTEEEFKQDPSKYTDLIDWSDPDNRTYEGLEKTMKYGSVYIIDDLRHNVPEYKLDKNGNIKKDKKGNDIILGYYTEFIMPPHFKEHMVSGKIPLSALRAFGVRIPSQDKHSTVSLKLVDWMPAHYGSVGIFPHELIEISGADFDIDKLYMQFADSYVKNGERIAYGTAQTDEEKFEEYVEYMSSKNKAVKSELKTGGLTLEEALNETVEEENVIGVLKRLGYPSTPKEYKEWVKTKSELNIGLLNNQILADKIKLINNPHMVLSDNGDTPRAFQVATVDPLKDLVDEFINFFGKGNGIDLVEDVLLEEGIDVDSMRGKYKSFKNNKEGSRNIGPAVNSMLAYFSLNTFGIKLKDKVGDKKFFRLNVDGVTFDGYHRDREFSGFENGQPVFKGKRIPYLISALVSAMTDNAKERLAAKLGLNIDAVGIVANLLAQGVPMRTALLIVLQPAVREYYEYISVINNNVKNNFEERFTKSNAIKEITKKYLAAIGADNAESIPITTQLLEDNIRSNGNNPQIQYAVLQMFEGLSTQTGYFLNVAQVLKLTKGLPTNWEDINRISEAEETLQLDSPYTEYMESAVPFDHNFKRMFTEDSGHTFINAYRSIKKEIEVLSKTVFLEKTKIFKYIQDTINDNFRVDPRSKTDFDRSLKRDITSFLSLRAYIEKLKKEGRSERLKSLDNALIYDKELIEKPEGFKDIIDIVREIRQKLPDNYFANKFLNIIPVTVNDLNSNTEIVNPNLVGGINIIEANTWAKLSRLHQEKITDSFIEIYSNPDTNAHAINLFHYLLVKDGGLYKNGSYIRFIPTPMLESLLKSTSKAVEILKDDNINDEVYKDVFGKSSSELFDEFLHIYSTNVNNSYFIEAKPVDAVPDTSKLIAEDKLPKINYSPNVLTVSENLLTIDLFGGIRKTELMEVETNTGRTQIIEYKQKGSFSPLEKDKLKWNIEYLKAKKFSVEAFTNAAGKKISQVSFPYVMKIKDNKLDTVTYYILSKVGKEKGSISNLLDPGQTKVTGTFAVYKKFNLRGSRKASKINGMFSPNGMLPETNSLKNRAVINNKTGYALDKGATSRTLDADIFLHSVERDLGSEYDLNQNYGIESRFIDDEYQFFKSGKLYETSAKSPSELIDLLENNPKKETEQNKAELQKLVKEPIKDSASADVDDIVIDEERKAKATAKLAAFRNQEGKDPFTC